MSDLTSCKDATAVDAANPHSCRQDNSVLSTTNFLDTLQDRIPPHILFRQRWQRTCPLSSCDLSKETFRAISLESRRAVLVTRGSASLVLKSVSE
eukprot:766195-Hanusia_phi.AAC.8